MLEQNKEYKDPLLHSLLDLLYNQVDEKEKIRLRFKIDDNHIAESVWLGLKKEKYQFKFKDKREHLTHLDKQEEEVINLINLKIKKSKTDNQISLNKRANSLKRLTYASSIAATILLFLYIGQLIKSNNTYDNYVAKNKFNALKNKFDSIKPIADEYQELSSNNRHLSKQVDSLNNTLIAKNKKIKFLKRTPTIIDKLNWYKSLAKAKGFKNTEELFRFPDKTGQYAGGSEKLRITLLTPKKLSAYFLNKKLHFSWSTNLKGEGKLHCYVAETMDDAFQKNIDLSKKSISVSVTNLKPAIYFWFIEQNGKISKQHYFVLIP